MNNWKEHPHLFANGEFQVRETAEYNDVFNIQGVYRAIDGVDAWLIPSSIDYSFHVDNCTLIARRIKDMSNEELMDHLGTDSKIFYEEVGRKQAIRIVHQECEINVVDLFLLSRGVYPFNQSHFELPDDHESKVININEI